MLSFQHMFEFWKHCHIHFAVILVINFRSMDGVREHARNHEQQEQVSEIFYITAEAGQEGPNSQCEEDCPYQSKEKHYHCTWVSFLSFHWIGLSSHPVGHVGSSRFPTNIVQVQLQAFPVGCALGKEEFIKFQPFHVYLQWSSPFLRFVELWLAVIYNPAPAFGLNLKPSIWLVSFKVV